MNQLKQDLALATLLLRPVGFHHGSELQKETGLSKENYGSIRCVYLLCENDNILKHEFQKWIIENNPSDEVKRISAGADHMAMFSKPQELYFCLQEIAKNY
ncbi:methyl esterase 10 [Abeliophyllum distichum]|uniref:Methyl esterase 10 n=1 Tax=Abeliophyllum distichum TaxID=126358 RepID=A0ABD1UPC8_9LAMI